MIGTQVNDKLKRDFQYLNNKIYYIITSRIQGLGENAFLSVASGNILDLKLR